jgi:hypothetical protein
MGKASYLPITLRIGLCSFFKVSLSSLKMLILFPGDFAFLEKLLNSFSKTLVN